MPDKMPEDMPDRMLEGMPDRMSDRMPEDMPDKVPECLPEHMPEDLPDRMSEDMPDKMPEDMSDRMPEDLPVTKCINVMVGITRSKVISQSFPHNFYIFLYYPTFDSFQFLTELNTTVSSLGSTQNPQTSGTVLCTPSIFTSLHRVFYHGAKASRGRQFFKFHRRLENPAARCGSATHCENVIRSNPTANSSKT